jgi:hypothetical protein
VRPLGPVGVAVGEQPVAVEAELVEPGGQQVEGLEAVGQLGEAVLVAQDGRERCLP